MWHNEMVASQGSQSKIDLAADGHLYYLHHECKWKREHNSLAFGLNNPDPPLQYWDLNPQPSLLFFFSAISLGPFKPTRWRWQSQPKEKLSCSVSTRWAGHTSSYSNGSNPHPLFSNSRKSPGGQRASTATSRQVSPYIFRSLFTT